MKITHRFVRTIAVAAPVLLVAGLTGPRGTTPPAVQAAVLQQGADRDSRADDANTGIVVQGVGEVTVKPDIARLNLGVQTQAKEAAQAAADNARQTDALIKAVRAAGVSEADIQTTDYSVNAQYNFDNGKQTLIGYVATNTVRVTVRKVADAGKVIDAAVQAGANAAGGIQFDLSDPSAAQDQALAKAVAAATRKAKVIAKAAGMTAIQVAAISEAGAPDFPRPMFAGAIMAKAEVANTPIQPGEQKVTANVTVRFIDRSIVLNQLAGKETILGRFPGTIFLTELPE